MLKRTVAKRTISIAVLTVLAVLYGLSLYLYTPDYWETIVLSALVCILFGAACVRFTGALVDDIAGDGLADAARSGDRTYRRCGVRELFKLILLILVLRQFELLLTYVLHLHLFGYGDTFFTVQRLWLDFHDASTAFPLYTYLSNLFWIFSFNFNHARFIGSYLFTALAGAALYYLVVQDYDRKTARRAVRYYLFLPLSCLLMGTVPDGLFLLLSALSLLFMRKKQYPLANYFAMLATLTHALGVLLFFPIVFEYAMFLINNLRSNREMGKGYLVKQIFTALSFLMVPIGVGLVMLYSEVQFGDWIALYRAAIGVEHAGQSFGVGMLFRWFDVIFDTTRVIAPGTIAHLCASSIPQILYFVLACALVLIGSRRVRVSYLLLIVITVPVVIGLGRMDEFARAMTMTVPIYIALSTLVRRKTTDAVLTAVMLIGWIVYFYAFIAGYTGRIL